MKPPPKSVAMAPELAPDVWMMVPSWDGDGSVSLSPDDSEWGGEARAHGNNLSGDDEMDAVRYTSNRLGSANPHALTVAVLREFEGPWHGALNAEVEVVSATRRYLHRTVLNGFPEARRLARHDEARQCARRVEVPYAQVAGDGATDDGDAVAPGLMIAYGIGRIGCHVAGDGDWGTESTLPWAVAYENAIVGWDYPPGVRVHPTPIYEAVAYTLLFLAMLGIRKRGYREGTVFCVYLIGSSAVRFLVEFIRINPTLAMGLTGRVGAGTLTGPAAQGVSSSARRPSSTAVSIMATFAVFFLAAILTSHRQIEAALATEWAASLVRGFYWVLPKTGQLAQATVDFVSGGELSRRTREIDHLAVFGTTGLFGLVSLSLSAYLFRRKDF